ncbi:MAG: RNA polymerase sigma factor, partial [bacterium]
RSAKYSMARSSEFESIVRPHLDYLYALAVRLCGSRTMAEDIVQDALLRAFRGLTKLRNREQPRLWLTRILTTAFYDRLRTEHAGETVSVDESFDLFDKIVEEDPFPYSDRVHLDFLEIFDDMKIIEVLQRLQPSHRVALILAYVYEYKTREIAAIMNKPLGTVLAWLHRGRKRLEGELWEYANRNRLLTPQQEARV